jgi:uncharacterized protein YfaP (DUF2135 family)
MDIDDTNGLGPENINIDSPQAGTYRVVVHYYQDPDVSGPAPTRSTVRINVNGVQVAEYQRTLQEETMWTVADITWAGDGGSVVPFASDAAGQVGTIAPLLRTQCTQ